MFQWSGRKLLFEPQKFPGFRWRSEFAQAPCSLVFDDYVRIYFATRPPRDMNGQYVSYTGFVDVDRANLSRILRVSESPVMALGKRGTFDEFGTYPMSVIRLGNRVLGYYAGWTRCVSTPYNVSIGLCVSDDGGTTFKRVAPGPLITASIDDPVFVSGPKIRYFNNRFHLWYIAGEQWIQDSRGRPESIFKIRHAVSDDGIVWERTGVRIIESVLGEYECQASPDVIEIAGTYHMFFCFKHGTDFRGTSRGYRLGYARSTDLETWTRCDELVGLHPRGSKHWDGLSVSYPHLFELDGKYRLLYLGNEVGLQGFGTAELVHTPD